VFQRCKLKLAAIVCVVLGSPGLTQVTPIDPNNADRYQSGSPDPAYTPPNDNGYEPVDTGSQDPYAPPAAPAEIPPPVRTTPSDTVPRDDVIGAAEGVFGKGAKGLAEIIEKILKDQGEPSAYITGREAGAAFVLGLRYGSGTMRHEIEGDRPVYWTGPSVGFDAGADANKVFVLVYNLHDSQDLFRAFPAAEGNVYVVGGFTGSYLRRGDIVLIPIRLGVGLRLGVNAGYMRFSEKNRWFPF
jgi:hypothetical protein